MEFHRPSGADVTFSRHILIPHGPHIVTAFHVLWGGTPSPKFFRLGFWGLGFSKKFQSPGVFKHPNLNLLSILWWPRPANTYCITRKVFTPEDMKSVFTGNLTDWENLPVRYMQLWLQKRLVLPSQWLTTVGQQAHECPVFETSKLLHGGFIAWQGKQGAGGCKQCGQPNESCAPETKDNSFLVQKEVPGEYALVWVGKPGWCSEKYHMDVGFKRHGQLERVRVAGEDVWGWGEFDACTQTPCEKPNHPFQQAILTIFVAPKQLAPGMWVIIFTQPKCVARPRYHKHGLGLHFIFLLMCFPGRSRPEFQWSFQWWSSSRLSFLRIHVGFNCEQFKTDVSSFFCFTNVSLISFLFKTAASLEFEISMVHVTGTWTLKRVRCLLRGVEISTPRIWNWS